MRRFAALALVTSLLHLNLVRADIACAGDELEHDTPHGTMDHATHDGHVAAAADHLAGTHEPASSDESCERPVQADCCQALASCSTAIGGATEVAIGSVAPENRLAVAALIEIPLSRVTTPDPPPPKA
jgi:hypothetical protein